jgi:Niemann-Pick C1 protein
MLRFALLFVLTLLFIQYTNAKCVMTAPGYFNKTTESYPTMPNEEPFILPSDVAKTLFEICDEYPVNSLVCCNTTQVSQMAQSFKKIDLTLWHCSACMTSFKRLWCDFTCSVNQSDFVGIMEMQQPPYEKFIQLVSYEVTDNFEKEFWSSCKNNKLGVVDLQTQFGNVRNMLQGMVDLQGTKVSPLIKYTYSGNNVTGYNGHVIPCADKCYCAYCSDACSGGTIVPDYSCKMFKLPCLTFGIIIVSILFGLFVIALIAAVIQRWLKWYRNISNVPSKKSINTRVNEKDRLLSNDQDIYEYSNRNY